ncbi:MBL fold metallo-hydrolase [Methylobacterium sp. UNC378MF]|uniref:MBL fold metallo-hydrolase n=1 Tax=Methylobacterium sp. UNC378MF TaxID=1502748 RepID=UPI000B890F86|nr:MBL fold metallo-hydrolase [Methylobacterium sp. UNC378MF]
MTTHRIVTVPIPPRGMVNSFILVGDRAVLVGTGVPGSMPKILAALARGGLAPSDISLFLITHRHVDHTGSAAGLKHATSASDAVQSLDAEWLRRGDGRLRPLTGWGGRLLDRKVLPRNLRVEQQDTVGQSPSAFLASPHRSRLAAFGQFWRCCRICPLPQSGGKRSRCPAQALSIDRSRLER